MGNIGEMGLSSWSASDHRHRGLLRARRERPCGSGTAEKRDELAPFPLTEMHPIPSRARSTLQGYRIAADQSAGIRAVHARASLRPRLSEFGFREEATDERPARGFGN